MTHWADFVKKIRNRVQKVSLLRDFSDTSKIRENNPKIRIIGRNDIASRMVPAIRGDAREGAEVKVPLHTRSRGVKRARKGSKRIPLGAQTQEFANPRRCDIAPAEPSKLVRL